MVRSKTPKTFNLRKLPKAVWDEFVYGGHFLALGDALTLYVIGDIIGLSVTWDFVVIIYLCVFASNLFNRSNEVKHDKLTNPVRVKIMQKYVDNFYPIIISTMSVVVGLILYYSNPYVLLFAGIIFLISILYTSILKKMTQYIISFKSIVAATFYSLMILLMIIYYYEPLGWAVVLLFIFYFIRIYISNAACDVKDVKSDKRRGLKTLFVTFGIKKSTRILNLINVSSGLLIIYGVLMGIIPNYSLGILLTIPYAFFYFSLYQKVNNEVLANLVVDGEFLLWLPFLMIGKALL